MELGDAVNQVIIQKLIASIIENDMVATRALLNSVRYTESNLLEETTITILALDYIVGLNDGIEPGATPIPTIADLEQWIAAKGLSLNPWAVRTNIIKNGTTWFQQGGSNIVTDAINDEAFKQVIELSRPELQNKIKLQWQLLFSNNP